MNHGMYRTPTHNTWRAMRDRLKPHHKSYGRYKNISIDERWLNDFNSFYADMGDRPLGTTLDRIDNNEGYFKWNCRWATAALQQQNKNPSERNCNGYPGICHQRDKFIARIRYNGKRIYLGSWSTEEEAHNAYDKKGRELYGIDWISYFRGQQKR